MAQVIVEMTSDEAKLLRGMQSVIAKEAALKAGLDDAGAAGKKSGEALEKATRKTAKEFDSLLREMRKMGPEGKAQADAVERHLRNTGQAGRRSMDGVVESLGKLDNEAAKVARAAISDLKRVGKQGEAAFGDPVITKLGGLAAGWLSVSAAVSAVSAGLADVREEQGKALASLKGTIPVDQRLLQISQSGADFSRMTGTADNLAKKYGVDRKQMRELMFSARSEGFAPAVGSIAAASPVLSVGAQATVAGQVPGLFGKEGLKPMQAINMGLVAAEKSRLTFEELSKSMPSAAEGGSIAGASSVETFASLSVLASRFKSGETAADRLKAFATHVGLDKGPTAEEKESSQKAEEERAAAAQKRYRTLQEQVADAERSLADAKKRGSSPEQIERLQIRRERAERAVSEFDTSQLEAKKITYREPLAGLGIVKAAEKLLSMPEGEQREFLGESQEVNAAFTIITEELPKIRDRMAVIQEARDKAGTSESAVSRKVAVALANPKQRAAIEERRSAIREEIEREKRRGITEAGQQTAIQNTMASLNEEGANGLRMYAAKGFGELGSLFGMNPAGNAHTMQLIGGEGLRDLQSRLVPSEDMNPQQRQGRIGLGVLAESVRNRKNASETLSPVDVSMFTTLSGNSMSPREISREQAEMVQKRVEELAQSDSMGVTGLQSQANAEIADALNDIRAILSQQLTATEQTAGNTAPSRRPINYSSGLQSGAAAATP